MTLLKTTVMTSRATPATIPLTIAIRRPLTARPREPARRAATIPAATAARTATTMNGTASSAYVPVPVTSRSPGASARATRGRTNPVRFIVV